MTERFQSSITLPMNANTTKMLVDCLKKRKVEFRGEMFVDEGKRMVRLICNADAIIQTHILFWNTVWECQKYCCLVYDSSIHEFWKNLRDSQRIMFFNSTKVTVKLLFAEPVTLILSSYCKIELARAKELLSAKAQTRPNIVVIPIQRIEPQLVKSEIPKVVYKRVTEQNHQTSCHESPILTVKVPQTNSFEPTTRQLLLKLATDQELVIKRIMSLEQEIANLRKSYGPKLLERIETKTEEMISSVSMICKNCSTEKKNQGDNSKNIADILNRLIRIESFLMEIQRRSMNTGTISQSQQTQETSHSGIYHETNGFQRDETLSMSNDDDIDSIIKCLNREINELKGRLPTFDGVQDARDTISSSSQSSDSLESYSSSFPLKIHKINIEFPLNLTCQIQSRVKYWTDGNITATANFFVEPFNKYCSLCISSEVSGEVILIATDVWNSIKANMDYSQDLKQADITRMFTSWSITEKLLFQIKNKTNITYNKEKKMFLVKGWTRESVDLTSRRLATMVLENIKPSYFTDFYF